MAASDEVAKLQQHLKLLREQYVRLQQRNSELEQKYTQAVSTSAELGPDHFVTRLMALTADLFDKPLYSDISIQLSDRCIPAHKFVLAARSSHWNPSDDKLSETRTLDLKHLTPFVATIFIRWVYTDVIMLPSDQSAIIELLSASNKYHLPQLKEKCEQALISSVSVRNCIHLYQISEEHNAAQLKNYTLQIISNHWNDLNTADFAQLSAPLLYDMFKAHSSFPLHLAIQHEREDVVFMFIIEHNSQLPQKLDESDDQGNIPLNLALIGRHEGIANTLVSHHCNLDLQDDNGNSLLHLAILRGDRFAASFLIKNGAGTFLYQPSTRSTPLHLVAQYQQSEALSQVPSTGVKDAPCPGEGMAEIASLLLEYHANPDAQDKEGFTPLQRAVQNRNRDVFQVLLKHPVLNLELRNNAGNTALWLALTVLSSAQLDTNGAEENDVGEQDKSFAAQLVTRGANPDSCDNRTGNCLLHLAAQQSYENAAVFLVRNGAKVDPRNLHGETPMHSAATNGMHLLVRVLLEYGADPNVQTSIKPRVNLPPQRSPAPVHKPKAEAPTVSEARSAPLYTIEALSSKTSTSSGVGGSSSSDHLSTAFDTSYATQQLAELSQLSAGPLFPSRSSPMPSPPQSNFASKKSTNPFDNDSDDEDKEDEAQSSTGLQALMMLQGSLLAPVDVDRKIVGGSTQTSPSAGRKSPSLVTGTHQRSASTGGCVSPESPPISSPVVKEFISLPETFNVTDDPGGRTALHLAIVHQHPKVVDVLLEHRANSVSSGRIQITLNIGLKDGDQDTPLSLALWTGQLQVAIKVVDTGADLECISTDTGMNLLYRAIIREQPSACLFLLDHGANFRRRTAQNETMLLLAIRHQLEPVADRLCDLGAEVGVADSNGNSPLWVALRSRQKSIAAKLIAHGCDPNGWETFEDGSGMSLLHRSIELQDHPTACFLIESGADVNSCTQPSDASKEPASAPLHMACQRGLKEIVTSLVNHHANVNSKDSLGRTPLHVSIFHKSHQCSDVLLAQPTIDLTLKDRDNHTPFSAALAVKDHEAGKAILKREPKAAEQVNSQGQNFLHLAVLNNDVESLIFLLSVNADVNSKVRNLTLNTPLHFAVKNGSEILVRHLLLAGGRIGDVDNHQRSAVHMAVEGNFHSILLVLLDNKADPDQTDDEGNNALHIAMQLGHYQCARVLIEDSNVNLVATNSRGQNCLHRLAAHPKANVADMFLMLKNVLPTFPLNKQDGDGNTPLLLAYQAGSTPLCDALIQARAHPGIANKQGTSIFNASVATKQLLYRILDQIHEEPSWLEGQNCMECGIKFNISTRKHHCRHCGRLLCNKCTSQQLPIVKFELSKPVRVCETCGDSFRH